jgi:hypothetical protein
MSYTGSNVLSQEYLLIGIPRQLPVFPAIQFLIWKCSHGVLWEYKTLCKW